jgi:hypothetical protein
MSASAQASEAAPVWASRRSARPCRGFACDEGSEIAAELVEVETGKGSDALDRRPQLAASLAQARALRCPVAVAKLDRHAMCISFPA